MKLSGLQIALLISVGFHAGLLALRVADPERFNRIFEDTPLEVVLVNARSNEAPVKAQVLGQVHLAGGGDAESGMVTSPLPASKLLEVGESTEAQYARMSQLQQEQQQLLTGLRRQLAETPAIVPQRESSSKEAQAQIEKRRQLLEYLAVIEKRVNAENARPKKRYLSPAVGEVAYAQYYDKAVRKIEDLGTRNYPTHAGKKLYGTLTMNIHIDLNGRVLMTEILKSSGDPNLDRRAEAIVRAAAPYGQFSSAMRKDAEILVLTRRFRFSREDGLETTVSGTPR